MTPLRFCVLSFFLTGLFPFCFAQSGAGAIAVSACYNTDNNLHHNQPIEEVELLLVKTGSQRDTVLNGTVTAKISDRKSLSPGTYVLTARYGTYAPIVLKEVVISSDRITFIDLLFEPEQRHRRKFDTGK